MKFGTYRDNLLGRSAANSVRSWTVSRTGFRTISRDAVDRLLIGMRKKHASTSCARWPSNAHPVREFKLKFRVHLPVGLNF
jgi:hypothetical protein